MEAGCAYLPMVGCTFPVRVQSGITIPLTKVGMTASAELELTPALTEADVID
jgi:hypothetical protein